VARVARDAGEGWRHAQAAAASRGAGGAPKTCRAGPFEAEDGAPAKGYQA